MMSMIGNNITSAYVAGTGLLFDWNADNAPSLAGVMTGNLIDTIAGKALAPTLSPLVIAGAVNGHAGIRFNGSTQQLATTTSVVVALPFEVWTVQKIILWVNNGAIWSGAGGSDACAYGANGSTPGLGMYAGTAWSGSNVDLAVGTYGIVRTVVNGASSTISVNNGTVVGSNPGNNSFNGTFYLGAFNGGSFLNCEVSRLLIVNPNATGYNSNSLYLTLAKDYF